MTTWKSCFPSSECANHLACSERKAVYKTTIGCRQTAEELVQFFTSFLYIVSKLSVKTNCQFSARLSPPAPFMWRGKKKFFPSAANTSWKLEWMGVENVLGAREEKRLCCWKVEQPWPTSQQALPVSLDRCFSWVCLIRDKCVRPLW